jgi:hypothetical protein
MFKRLDCVCLHSTDLDVSLSFLLQTGLTETWRLNRTTKDGTPWTLVGLDFPDKTSSQIVLSTHPDRKFIEVEMRVDDVRETRAQLDGVPGVEWIAEPSAIEEGHVAVMCAPDGNAFVLIGN